LEDREKFWGTNVERRGGGGKQIHGGRKSGVNSLNRKLGAKDTENMSSLQNRH